MISRASEQGVLRSYFLFLWGEERRRKSDRNSVPALVWPRCWDLMVHRAEGGIPCDRGSKYSLQSAFSFLLCPCSGPVFSPLQNPVPGSLGMDSELWVVAFAPQVFPVGSALCHQLFSFRKFFAPLPCLLTLQAD